MKSKPIYTDQRLLLLLMMAVLCVLRVNVTRYPLTKYDLPVIGWVLGLTEYRQAHDSYLQAIDRESIPSHLYFATQTPYEHTQVASHSTLAFMALCLIVINRLWRRNRPELRVISGTVVLLNSAHY